MIGEEPPFERRRMTILMLPNELILSCLARVSRLYYPTLSLASKRFRLLLASKELYQIRTLLGCAETCLYVCLRLHNDRRLRWFTLCRRPNSPRNILVPISSTDVPFESSSDVAMVGPNIYIIGGLVNKKVSSSVKVIDCRSHTLHEAPSMQVARVFPSACVLGEKIYVAGGCKNIDSMKWMEVFDTKTQTWEFLQTSPNQELYRGFKYSSFGYEGTVYVRSEDKGLVAYKLYKGRWRAIDLPMNLGWSLSFSCCVIDNVFYRYNGRTIDWYDHKERLWKTLKGLERLPRIRGNVKLVDYGGKMMVLCKEYVSEETPIWCTAITLERRREGEILGTPEWFDVVYTSNMEYNLVHALATFI